MDATRPPGEGEGVGANGAGKSTLLNALLNEERAIVSEIAGTTRDTIEDEINIHGISFRFIDTAGIRETQDIIEAKGVERTFEKIKTSAVVMYLFDPSETSLDELETIITDIKTVTQQNNSSLIVVSNKVDIHPLENHNKEIIQISAKEKQGLDTLENALLHTVNLNALNTNEVVISNIRHLEALQNTQEALNRVLYGIDNPITSDFLALDIKQALHYLGEIVGVVTTDDLLENIFSKFCIGK